MTTGIDANVIIALWDKNSALSLAAQNALEAAFNRGNLVVAAPVFAELIAAPGRTEASSDHFSKRLELALTGNWAEQVWRFAGRAFKAYAERRRKKRDAGTRRILADSLVGADAVSNGFRLLTLDGRLYRVSFPLVIETF